MSNISGYSRGTSLMVGPLNLNQNISVPYVADLARVAMIRGSHGQIYGRNTIGGLIRLQLRQPSAEFGGYAKAGIERFGAHFLEAAHDVPISDDLSLRFSGLLRESDGEVKNLSPGGSTGAHSAVSGPLLGAWQIDDWLTATSMVTHNEEDEGLTRDISADIFPQRQIDIRDRDPDIPIPAPFPETVP